LLAHGAGLAAGRAFLGFAAHIHLIAAFLAGKDSHDYTSESDKLTVSGHRGKKRRWARRVSQDFGGHIIRNNTSFRQDYV
jgi:hypothetical protein